MNEQQIQPEIARVLQGIRGTQRDVATLCKKYNLFYSVHPDLPLVLFCYDNRFSPNCLLTQQCRGLILEKDTWKTVCWGMNRFVDKKSLSKFNMKSVQQKEDGSLLFLFLYNGQWMLSTRHTFCDQPSEQMYLQGFLSVTQCDSVNAFGLKMESIGLQRCTFCFELCLSNHRIVRKYETSKIFLLCVYDNITHNEVDMSVVNIPEIERVTENSTQNTTIQELLDQCVAKDPFFEGFVIIDQKGNRHKLKSNEYRIIHDLRYRGWVKTTPKSLKFFIDHDHDKLILDFLKETRPTDWFEFERQFICYKNFKNSDNLQAQLLDLSLSHAKEYCPLPVGFENNDKGTGLSETMPIRRGKTWDVTCFCGHAMTCNKLKYDVIYKRKCHCGEIFGTIVYPNNTLLWQCSVCDCSHECYQKDETYDNVDVTSGQPLGIPASHLCKTLRLQVHENILKRMKLLKCKKSEVYAWIQDVMQLSKEDAHIAKFGISQCTKLLQIFQKNY